MFAGHRLTLNAIVAKTPYNGAPKEVRGTIEIPCNGYITGKVGINPKFLSDITSAFSDDVELRLYLPDGKEGDPMLLETDGNYSCVMMPLHDSVDTPIIPAAQAERERKEIEAKADLEKRIAENTIEQNRRTIEDNVRKAQRYADTAESDLADAPDTWDLSDKMEICRETISAIEHLRDQCRTLSDEIPADAEGDEQRESAFADMLEKVNRIQSQLESDDLDNEDTSKQTLTTDNLFAKSELLYIEAKNITATGYESEEGFLVCKGSQAVVDEAPSLQKYYKNAVRIRKSLIEQGILKMDTAKSVYVFTQNYTFDSETHAANVILGVSTHGDERWKDESGTPLKEMKSKS